MRLLARKHGYTQHGRRDLSLGEAIGSGPEGADAGDARDGRERLMPGRTGEAQKMKRLIVGTVVLAFASLAIGAPGPQTPAKGEKQSEKKKPAKKGEKQPKKKKNGGSQAK